MLLSIIYILSTFQATKKNNTEKFDTVKPLNKFFDNIYIITMDNRKIHIEKLMKKLELKYQMISALTPKNMPIENIVNAGYIHEDSELNLGRKYCHASHMYTISIFLSSNYNNCLILEDDLEYSKYYHEIDTVMQHVPANFDILYLGYCWDVCRKQERVNEYISIPYYPKCRHAYALSKKGALKIMHYIKPMKEMPGDKLLGTLVRERKLIAYCVTNPIFLQNRVHFKSNLGNQDSLKFCV